MVVWIKTQVGSFPRSPLPKVARTDLLKKTLQVSRTARERPLARRLVFAGHKSILKRVNRGGTAEADAFVLLWTKAFLFS